MTENGTWRLGEMDYFPCQCPRCATANPKQVIEMSKVEKNRFLAEHNLHVCVAELKRIKQAIRDGRLWEHVEMRAHAHPALLTALKRVKNYEDYIEKHSPTVKQSGFFFFDGVGLVRPEIAHYRERLAKRYNPPREAKTLLLVPQDREKPFHRSERFKEVRRIINRCLEEQTNTVHVCFYAAPFGVIPLELDEVYPLSQHETSMPLECEVKNYVARQVAHYIKRSNYGELILLDEPKNWGSSIRRECKRICTEKGIRLEILTVHGQTTKEFLVALENILKKSLTDQP
jgi:7-cyano-7-deazaguanine tRNA-ribosyltransferase